MATFTGTHVARAWCRSCASLVDLEAKLRSQFVACANEEDCDIRNFQNFVIFRVLSLAQNPMNARRLIPTVSFQIGAVWGRSRDLETHPLIAGAPSSIG